MRCQLVYSVVIFSHRFLDSDCINFKTFAFLAVYWPSEHHYTALTSKFNNFLNRSSTMLINVFNHGRHIGTYCKQTAELLVSLYPWFHNACEHPCPINSLSFDPSILHPASRDDEHGSSGSQEQGQLFWQRHARKTSWADNMHDVFHRLMVTGDVIISTRSISTPKPQAYSEKCRGRGFNKGC